MILRATLRNIYNDYHDTYKDVRRVFKDKPLKAGLYTSSIVFLLNLFRQNESLHEYRNEVTTACNKMFAVVDKFRNPESYKFIETVGEMNHKGRLRQLNLGFATLIYHVDANPEVALYRDNCKYLNPSIREFLEERIVDLGLLGHWFHLEKKMKNYDINEDEYDMFEDK